MVMERRTFFEILTVTVSLRTIERWRKTVRDTGSINLSSPLGRQRTIRIKGNIQKIKHRLDRRKSLSTRKTDRQLSISRISIRKILKNDLHRTASLIKYKMNDCSLMSIKTKRVKFANWIRTNF